MLGNRCTKTNTFSAIVEIKAWKKLQALTYLTPLELPKQRFSKKEGKRKESHDPRELEHHYSLHSAITQKDSTVHLKQLFLMNGTEEVPILGNE